VKVTVPSVQILVRRCGSGNAFSNTCTIAAGGCDSAEQKADVRIQLTPAIAGIPVNIPQITGGQGVRVGSASNDAKIVLNDSYISYMEDETDGQYVTDAFGRVEGTYWGSNVLDSTTLSMPSGGTPVTINQVPCNSSASDLWQCDPNFVCGVPRTITFSPRLGAAPDNPPICGHSVELIVTRVDVLHGVPPKRVSYITPNYYTAQAFTAPALGSEVHLVSDLGSFAQFSSGGLTYSDDGRYSADLTVFDAPRRGAEIDIVLFDAVDGNVWVR
jgi:hypothetical protein